jgi:hypothetical protein
VNTTAIKMVTGSSLAGRPGAGASSLAPAARMITPGNRDRDGRGRGLTAATVREGAGPVGAADGTDDTDGGGPGAGWTEDGGRPGAGGRRGGGDRRGAGGRATVWTDVADATWAQSYRTEATATSRVPAVTDGPSLTVTAITSTE